MAFDLHTEKNAIWKVAKPGTHGAISAVLAADEGMRKAIADAKADPTKLKEGINKVARASGDVLGQALVQEFAKGKGAPNLSLKIGDASQSIYKTMKPGFEASIVDAMVADEMVKRDFGTTDVPGLIAMVARIVGRCYGQQLFDDFGDDLLAALKKVLPIPV